MRVCEGFVVASRAEQDVAPHHDAAVHEIVAANEMMPNRIILRLQLDDGLKTTGFVDLVRTTADKGIVRVRFQKPNLGFKTVRQGYVIGIHDRDVGPPCHAEGSVP